MTGGEALASQMAVEGITEVFGVPGVQLDYALDGLSQRSDKIRFVGARHEQGAAYMADGYARATRDVGAFMVVPGPGVLNAGAGLATAYACSSRVLCIAGQIPTWAQGKHLGVLHEIGDQGAVLDAVTKTRVTASGAAEIPTALHEAIRQVRSGQPAPVALEVAADLLQQQDDIELVESDDGDTPSVAPDATQIRRAAALLRGARTPTIYVGGGVTAADAATEVLALAERLGAAVIVGRGGRGAVTDRHPLVCSGLAGRHILPASDVCLVVGSRFVSNAGTTIPTSPSTQLIGLNLRAADLTTPRTYAATIHADARDGLAALHEALADVETDSHWADRLAAARDWAAGEIAKVQPQGAFIAALRDGMDDDAILVSDLTQVGYLSSVAYEIRSPGTYFAPGYQGTLGYAFPTALGAKVAQPDRQVVCIVGDGGFGWCLQELATARKYGIAATTVVFNDNAFGNVRRIQRESFQGRYISSDLVNPDFVQLGRSFGVDSSRVTSPEALAEALRSARRADRPTLIEVPVGEMPSGWHLVMDTPPAARADDGTTERGQ
jgi:acetolactate synthase-1/2/3 large subunit